MKNIPKMEGIPIDPWQLCGASHSVNQKSDSLRRLSLKERVDVVSQNFDFLVFDGCKIRAISTWSLVGMVWEAFLTELEPKWQKVNFFLVHPSIYKYQCHCFHSSFLLCHGTLPLIGGPTIGIPKSPLSILFSTLPWFAALIAIVQWLGAFIGTW